MRTETYKQIVPVMAKDPVEAASKFNDAMYELRKFNPTFERVSESVFYIFYNKTDEVVESIIDEFNLKGVYKSCGECPYFTKPLNRFGQPDGRVKKGFCTKFNKTVYMSSGACELLYKMLKGKQKKVDITA